MISNRVAFHVLANRSLFQSIVAFSSGVPYFVFQVKEQLVCVSEAYNSDDFDSTPDEELWQNAVCSGDKCTLEAFQVLSQADVLGERVDEVLESIMGFALTHTKDLELLDWIYDTFTEDEHREITFKQHGLLGEQGDVEVVEWLLNHPDMREMYSVTTWATYLIHFTRPWSPRIPTTFHRTGGDMRSFPTSEYDKNRHNPPASKLENGSREKQKWVFASKYNAK